MVKRNIVAIRGETITFFYKPIRRISVIGSCIFMAERENAYAVFNSRKSAHGLKWLRKK